MSATSSVRIVAQTETDTQALAGHIAPLCVAGDVVALTGDLGAGKSTFARGFIHAISSTQDDITSPTFNIVQTYALRNGGQLWHYDLYRIERASELQELGMDEAFAEGISLIEWPNIARELLPPQTLAISIETTATSRIFTLSGNAAWHARLSTLESKKAG